MSITELGNLMIFLERIFGELTMANYEGKTSLRDSKNVSVAQFTIQNGRPSEVWLRMDKIPEGKDKEVKEALQSNRFGNIMT